MVEDVVSWIEAHPGTVQLVGSVLLVFVTALVTARAARTGVPTLQSEFEDPASYPTLIARYDRTGGAAYFAGIRRVLGFADWAYGPRLIGWRALRTCLILAFIYPYLALVLGWMLFDTRLVGGMQMVDTETGFGSRLSSGLQILATFSVFLLLMAYSYALAERLDCFTRHLNRQYLSTQNLLKKRFRQASLVSVAVLLSAFGAFIVAAFFPATVIIAVGLVGFDLFGFLITASAGVAVAGSLILTPLREYRLFLLGLPFGPYAFFNFFPGSAWLAGAVGAFVGKFPLNAHLGWDFLLLMVVPGVFVSIVARGLFGSNLGAASAAVGSAGALSGFYLTEAAFTQFPQGGQGTHLGVQFLLWALLLPTINALTDLVSLVASRMFLRHLEAHGHGVWRTLLHLVLDLCVAVMCLAFLLCAMVGLLELSEWGAGTPLAFQWRDYWADVRANPGHGTMLYLMVFTTLIPTLVHLIAGLGAIVTQRARISAEVAEALRAQVWTGEVLPVAVVTDLIRKVQRAERWGYFSATVLVLMPVALIAWAVLSGGDAVAAPPSSP
ncbi:MAG: hypothetical protein AAFX00_08360 [Pseudomonadota bacterium]